MNTQADPISYGYFCRYLFREVMRDLRDTELRVLFTVADKTLGWNKEDDWINRKQLKKLTGKGNTALVSAITVLTSREFVETRDENGNILKSPKERKLYGYTRHNTHFRINPSLVQKADKYFTGKRTLTHSHSEHYNRISYKTISSQTNGGEEVNPLKEKTPEETLAYQITDWMCRGTYNIQNPREKVFIQVINTVKAYGVSVINKIYDEYANGAQPGHPREFWNAVRGLREDRKPNRGTRPYGLNVTGLQSMGDIMKTYKLPESSSVKG